MAKKRILSLCLALLIVLSATIPAFAGPAGETEISTAQQLLAIEPSGNYILMADIDLGNETYSSSVIPSIEGILDGNGHTVSGININSSDEYVGFIGSNSGIVKNLRLQGKISVSAENATRVGGIVAKNSTRTATIENCINDMDITLTEKEQSNVMYSFYAGGITGTSGIVSGCINNGTIKVICDKTPSVVYSAGIAAYETSVTDSLNTADITATGMRVAYAGGICAFVGSGTQINIRNCQNEGNISASLKYSDEIDDSNASPSNMYPTAGGIAGYMANSASAVNGKVVEANCFSRIYDSLNKGNVSASNESEVSDLSFAGGIAGMVNGLVCRCVDLHEGTLSGNKRGPVFAAVNRGSVVRGKVRDCYYKNSDETYVTEVGAEGTVAAATALSETQLADVESFPGFDFEQIWGHGSDAMPVLQKFKYAQHDHDIVLVDQVDPGCTEPGKQAYYYCSICCQCFEDEAASTVIKDIESWGVIAQFGHDYIPNVTKPTCTEEGYTTYTCSRCFDSYIDDHTEALGHSFGAWKETIAATETEDGQETRECALCHLQENRVIPKLTHVHDMALIDQVDPTCTEAGKQAYYHCNDCGRDYEDDAALIAIDDIEKWGVIEKLGHDFGEWEVTRPATEQEEGEETRVCKNDPSHTETRPIAKLVPKIEFIDVAKDAFYAEPVEWAVANNITNGTGANTFSPNNKCTRGQVVTFLWRAAGAPEPASSTNPFTDVKESDYFYKAVLWAVENGVTSGTSKTTFSPASQCTRGQVVTFLWRAKGQTEPASTSHSFSDVEGGAYYYKAVLWAVEKNITNGTSATTFSPNNTCTRGQVVTFLYRAFN